MKTISNDGLDFVNITSSDKIVHGLKTTTTLLNPEISKRIGPKGSKNSLFNARNLTLISGEVKVYELTRLRKQTIQLLALLLVSEYDNESQVIIHGYKSISLTLADETENYSPSLLLDLCRVAEWINEEDSDKKRKLVFEQLSITLDQEESFITGLSTHLTEAYNYARKSYMAGKLDGNTSYLNEVESITNSLKNQSQVYIYKTRSTVYRLLKVTIIGILLAGAAYYTKFSGNTLERINLFYFVLNCIAIYFLTFNLFKTFIDIREILASRNRIISIRSETAELQSEEQYLVHIKKPLKGIKFSLALVYPILMVTYVFIAYICFTIRLKF
ncbi:MAG: hypothetical protein V4506_07310 [Bacteroidota bacterium]